MGDLHFIKKTLIGENLNPLRRQTPFRLIYMPENCIVLVHILPSNECLAAGWTGERDGWIYDVQSSFSIFLFRYYLSPHMVAATGRAGLRPTIWSPMVYGYIMVSKGGTACPIKCSLFNYPTYPSVVFFFCSERIIENEDEY